MPLCTRYVGIRGTCFPTCLTVDHIAAAAASAAKSLQSCPTLCDPTDGSPPRLSRPWDSPGKNTGVLRSYCSNAVATHNLKVPDSLVFTGVGTMLLDSGAGPFPVFDPGVTEGTARGSLLLY